jgi:hypothetical protein
MSFLHYKTKYVRTSGLRTTGRLLPNGLCAGCGIEFAKWKSTDPFRLFGSPRLLPLVPALRTSSMALLPRLCTKSNFNVLSAKAVMTFEHSCRPTKTGIITLPTQWKPGRWQQMLIIPRDCTTDAQTPFSPDWLSSGGHTKVPGASVISQRLEEGSSYFCPLIVLHGSCTDDTRTLFGSTPWSP